MTGSRGRFDTAATVNIVLVEILTGGYLSKRVSLTLSLWKLRFIRVRPCVERVCVDLRIPGDLLIPQAAGSAT